MRKNFFTSTASSFAIAALSAVAFIGGMPVTAQATNYCVTGDTDCTTSGGNSGTKVATGGTQALAAGDNGQFVTSGTYTVANGVTAGAISSVLSSTSTGQGTLTIATTGGTTGVGAVGDSTHYVGTVNTSGNGTITFGSTVRANTLNVGSTAATATTDAITNGVAAGSINNLKVFANVAGASVGGSGTSSKITTAGANSINLSSTAVTFDATNTTGASDRSKYTIATATGTGTVTGPSTYSTLNGATGYTYGIRTASDSQSAYVIQTLNSNYTATTTNGAGAANTSAVGTYLQNAVVGNRTDVSGNTVNTYLNTLGAASAGSKARILDQATVQSTVQTAANSLSTAMMDVVSERTGVMGGTHTASAGQTGMSAGDVPTGKALWGQAFGSVGRQDTNGGQAGFDTQNAGFAVGAETKVGKASSAGLSVAYSAGTFEGNEAGAAKKTTSNSYQASLYGSSYVQPNWFVDGQIGGGYHDFQSGNVYTAGGTQADADYSAWGYFGRIGTGYDIKTSSPAVVTPYASLSYSGMDFDDYTETGAGGLNRRVSRDTAETFSGRAGAKVAWQGLSWGGSKLVPEFRAAYLHYFDQSGLGSTANFVGTGSSSTFKNQGFKLADDGYTVGAGLKMISMNGWDFDANYDYEGRDGYQGHSGMIQAKYNF